MAKLFEEVKDGTNITKGEKWTEVAQKPKNGQ
jgi:hypothetical protein